MKKKPDVLSHRPFKRAHHYDSFAEAKKDGNVSDRMAKARMDAQKTAEYIKKNKGF